MRPKQSPQLHVILNTQRPTTPTIVIDILVKSQKINSCEKMVTW